MSLENFMNQAISPWMRENGPEGDIVLSTRIRLARNLEKEKFPIIAEKESLDKFSLSMKEEYDTRSFNEYENLTYLQMSELSYVEKRLLVEKHLVSPYLIKARSSAALISENEQMSVMINEEDHIRMQVYFPGFQVNTALEAAFAFDDWLEEDINYAFDEEKGYLTCCPTNTGTGLRVSVMFYLSFLVFIKIINRYLIVINHISILYNYILIYKKDNTAIDAVYKIDNYIEEEINYAFYKEKGYITSCPTNTGTGLRASVMIHLPGLVLTKRIKRILPVINQLGFVVRGIYGEGSEATGNVFQISNQITLGKSEADIVEDLRMIVIQLIEQERVARNNLLEKSRLKLTDRIYRSFGILKHSRVIELKEASVRISDIKLGVDLGIIEGLSHSILNELIILTQPGFLQHYANKLLSVEDRDELRAELIRKRLQIK